MTVVDIEPKDAFVCICEVITNLSNFDCQGFVKVKQECGKQVGVFAWKKNDKCSSKCYQNMFHVTTNNAT